MSDEQRYQLEETASWLTGKATNKLFAIPSGQIVGQLNAAELRLGHFAVFYNSFSAAKVQKQQCNVPHSPCAACLLSAFMRCK